MRGTFVVLLLAALLLPAALAAHSIISTGTGHLTVRHRPNVEWETCVSQAAFTVIVYSESGGADFAATAIRDTCPRVVDYFPDGTCGHADGVLRCYYSFDDTGGYYGYASLYIQGRVVEYNLSGFGDLQRVKGSTIVTYG